MSLVELSRLKYDQSQYDKAIVYYVRAIRALEDTDAPREAPIAFADILDEYANALQKTGNKAEGSTIKKRSDKIRFQNPQGYSITDRTPYGTMCLTN